MATFQLESEPVRKVHNKLSGLDRETEYAKRETLKPKWKEVGSADVSPHGLVLQVNLELEKA